MSRGVRYKERAPGAYLSCAARWVKTCRMLCVIIVLNIGKPVAELQLVSVLVTYRRGDVNVLTTAFMVTDEHGIISNIKSTCSSLPWTVAERYILTARFSTSLIRNNHTRTNETDTREKEVLYVVAILSRSIHPIAKKTNVDSDGCDLIQLRPPYPSSSLSL